MHNLILMATENSDSSMSWPDAIFGLGVLALIGLFFWLVLRD